MPVGKRKHQTRVGTRLGTHKDKTRTRMDLAARDPRRVAALEQARADAAALEARMDAEAARTAAALERWQTEEKARALRRRLGELERQRRLREEWPLADARHLVRQGYSVEGTMRRTGWPRALLADVRPGEW